MEKEISTTTIPAHPGGTLEVGHRSRTTDRKTPPLGRCGDFFAYLNLKYQDALHFSY
jgi:hypothetical protein